MKRKIAVSCSIFLLLLSVAWYLKQQNHREFKRFNMDSLNVVPMNNEITPLNMSLTTTKSTIQLEFFEPFKPREYVRIRKE